VRHCKERLDLSCFSEEQLCALDNYDLNAIDHWHECVQRCWSVKEQQGIEGGRAIRVCGRRHST